MTYTKQTLLTGETVTYHAKYHWWYLASPSVVLLIGFWIKGADSIRLNYIAYFLIFIGLIKLLNKCLNMIASEFVVTNRRIIFKTGFIKRRVQELILSKAEAVACSEDSILGRVLGFGSIVVTTGGATNTYRFINQPMAFGMAIHKAIGGDS